MLQLLKDVTITADVEEEKILRDLRKKRIGLEHVKNDLLKNSDEICNILDWLTRICIPEDSIEERKHSEEEEGVKIRKFSILRHHGHSSHHVTHGHHPSSHRLHQDLCRQEKVQNTVMALLESHLMSRDETLVRHDLENSKLRRIYTASFRFIEVFCAGNAKNQATLNTQHHLFFLQLCSIYEIGAELALSSVIRHNTHALEHVSEDFLSVALDQFHEYRACQSGAYLDFISDLMSARGFADRVMQNLVIESILDEQTLSKVLEEKIHDDSLSKGGFVDYISRCFRESQVDHLGFAEDTLHFLISLTRLLTLCAEGGNMEGKLKAETILPLNKALEIITAKYPIPFEVKGIFMAFLRTTFFSDRIDTENEEMVDEAILNAHKQEARRLLVQVVNVVHNVGDEFVFLQGELKPTRLGAADMAKHLLDPYVADKVSVEFCDRAGNIG